MTTLQAPEILIEWSDSRLGGFTDPTLAAISIYENRGIREAVKIWRRNESSMQLYYEPITETELRFAPPDESVLQQAMQDTQHLDSEVR